MSFEKLKLNPKLLQAITKCGYENTTPIQNEIIPHILKNRDVQAIAPTGSGKTASFVLPILHNILNMQKQHTNIKALIIAPTKELVVQIEKNIKNYALYSNIKSSCIYGGTKIKSDIKNLSNDIDILVCTTGRLSKHIKEKTINLNDVEYLVLDEADTLLEMGFINEINLTLQTIPQDAQVSLFSATMGTSIKKLSDKMLKKKVCVNIDKVHKATHKIDQKVYYISKEEKIDLLCFLIGTQYKDRFIVFTRTKESSKEIYEKLQKAGLNCLNLQGNMSQAARLKSIEMFKQHKAQVLVATDITARGIDIEALECIINYDIPNSVDDYIHRIGRTGRANKDGNAISFVSSSEIYSLKVIEQKLQLKMKEVVEDGFGFDIKDGTKSVKIAVRKDEKQKTKGAYGGKPNDAKRKKLKGKRSGWNIHDKR
jgi:superfamily II DNA/RNA helicase